MTLRVRIFLGLFDIWSRYFPQPTWTYGRVCACEFELYANTNHDAPTGSAVSCPAPVHEPTTPAADAIFPIWIPSELVDCIRFSVYRGITNITYLHCVCPSYVVAYDIGKPNRFDQILVNTDHMPTNYPIHTHRDATTNSSA